MLRTEHLEWLQIIFAVIQHQFSVLGKELQIGQVVFVNVVLQIVNLKLSGIERNFF